VNSGNPPARGELPDDHIKLLLQSTSVVRFANSFVDRYKASKNFVLVAMYFTRDAKVHHYLIYQEPPVRDHAQDTVRHSALM
jgi:hypothetical protein